MEMPKFRLLPKIARPMGLYIRAFILFIMKFIVFLLISLACVISTFASTPDDNKTSYYKHEVNISIGSIDAQSNWSDKYENEAKKHFNRYELDGTNVLMYKWSNDRTNLETRSPLMTVSYYYHFDRSIAVGGLFGLCGTQYHWGYPEFYELEKGKKKTGYTDIKGMSYFLMPSLKVYYDSSWGLYGKISAGFHNQSLYLDSDLIPKEKADEYKRSHLGFAYYFTPLGLEVGVKRVRWFMEFGIGSCSNVKIGLTYRF
ncbi:MAG: hypothetical protein IKZ48_03405 [Prevotella sp.]|nr:hypothetical protein [Prevotella sp.]